MLFSHPHPRHCSLEGSEETTAGSGRFPSEGTVSSTLLARAALAALLCLGGCDGESPSSDVDPVQDEDDGNDEAPTTSDAGKPRDSGSKRDAETPSKLRDSATDPADDSDHGSHGGASTSDSGMKDARATSDAAHGHSMDDMKAACSYHGSPDPRDDMLKDSKPVIINTGRSQDTMLPDVVLAWMKEREFAEAHDAWHLIRRWDQGCRKSNAPAAGCRSAERLESQGLWRAEAQQGAPGDGYAFMAMHRHMIHMLNDSFPKHKELFTGFKKVPRTRGDAENPHPWRNVSWTQDNIRGFDILENIEQNLDKFPTEDDLGRYFQTTFKWTDQRPTNSAGEAGAGLHGALHAQWAVSGSPGNLIDQKIDVYNFVFWKLHGWADDVWERYRKAKGVTDQDAYYKKIMLEQCLEMIDLQPSKRRGGGGRADGGVPGGTPGGETGVFAMQVRPILEEKCAGCHGEVGGQAGLTLGGSGVSSIDLIDGMVDADSSNGEYKLVAPGDPEKSWLYLKSSGGSQTAMCSGRCDRQKMPPSGAGLTDAELMTIRNWIMSGATEK